MKVHIGITSKNRYNIIRKAIQSALDQTYSDKSITVFDDASTDETPTLKGKFPQINWIISEEPKWLLYARNLFLEINDAEFFCSLDDDAWFINNNALEIAVDYMQKKQSVGAIAFDIVGPDNPDIKEIAVTPVETHM